MASLGIDPTDLIRTLFGAKSVMTPAVNRQGIPKRLALLAATGGGPYTSGSSNRTKFGLNDFGLQTPGSMAQGQGITQGPNVVGAGRNPAGGINLQDAARAAITGQYGPVLGEIANEMGMLRGQAAKDRTAAQQHGNRAEGDLATLYSRLREYAGNTQRGQDASYQQGNRQTNQRFNQLGNQVRQDLKTSGGGVAADLQRLGVDPSVALAGAAKDAAFTRSMAREDRANQVSNSRSSQREYDAGMGRMKNDIIATGNAAVGTQRSATNAALANIARALSSNMMQLNMQKAQTLGQRAAALGQLRLSQLQTAAQSKAAQNDPMARLNLLYKQAQIAHLLGQGGAAGSSSANSKVPNGMAAALQYIQGLPQFQGGANWGGLKGQELSKMLEDLQAKGSMATPPSGYAPWAPNQYGDVLANMIKQLTGAKGPRGGTLFNPADQQAAQNALMMALGMLK